MFFKAGIRDDDDLHFFGKLVQIIGCGQVFLCADKQVRQMHTAYKNIGFNIKDYPNAYDMFKGEVTLPSFSRMTDEQVDYVIECFKKVYGAMK